MVFAQRQKYRSMEQNRKPRDKSGLFLITVETFFPVLFGIKVYTDTFKTNNVTKSS